MTWAEYDVMCEGYAKEKERAYQERWESVRWEVFHLLNVQIAKKDRLKRLTDLIRFPWDAKVSARPGTREEFDELCRRWGKTLA